MAQERKYCVYRHVRLDTNETFYIGIGKKRRPFDKMGRSKFWQRVVTKTDYRVDVLFECLTWEECVELEKSLIWLYGRRDLGLGPLVNLTDGGEGSLRTIISTETRLKMSISGKKAERKMTEEHRLKLIKINKERFVTEESRLKMAKTRKERYVNCKKVIDTVSGIIYPSSIIVSNLFGIKKSTLQSYLKGDRVNKTTFKYLEDYEQTS